MESHALSGVPRVVASRSCCVTGWLKRWKGSKIDQMFASGLFMQTARFTTCYAHLLSRHGSISIVDAQDPSNAFLAGGVSLAPPLDPVAVAVRGNLGFAVANAPDLPFVDVNGEGGPSLVVIDGTSPASPVVVTTVPFAGEARAIALVDDLALVASGAGGLVVFSITP